MEESIRDRKSLAVSSFKGSMASGSILLIEFLEVRVDEFLLPFKVLRLIELGSDEILILSAGLPTEEVTLVQDENSD